MPCLSLDRMSKKNEQEIEEAHRKVRGEEKKVEKKPEQKKESSGKEKKGLDKKELREDHQKTAEELAEEQQEEELLQAKPGRDADLEEIARKGTAAPGSADAEYVQELSHKPMGEIYKEIKEIYKTVEDKGYLSPTEQKQVEYLSSAVQRKFEDEEQGTYSFSEQAARAASVTQQLSASMIGTYKGKKINEMYK